MNPERRISVVRWKVLSMDFSFLHKQFQSRRRGFTCETQAVALDPSPGQFA